MSENYINKKVYTHRHWERAAPFSKARFFPMALRDTGLLFVSVRSIFVLKRKKVSLKKKKERTETNEVRLTVQNKRPESNGVLVKRLTFALPTNKKTT